MHHQMDLYRRLPIDIQRYLCKFLPLWQRFGLHKPPQRDYIKCYYHALRRVPKNITGGGNCFYYSQKILQVELYLDYYFQQHEYWMIKISMRKKYDNSRIIQQLVNNKFYETIKEPSIAKRIRTTTSVIHNWHYPDNIYCKIEYHIERIDHLPTRQACVDALCDHMIELTKTAEKKIDNNAQKMLK